MATLAVIDTYARGNPALYLKFLAARLQCAWDVMAETPAVAARVAWAKKILGGYEADGQGEYLWFLSHSNVQTAGAAITDANCIAAVASFINAWAAEV